MGKMWRWTALSALLVIAAGCARQSAPPAPAAPAVEVSKPAAQSPQIEWTEDYAGGLAKAKEAGKPVMVDVFATWCGPCRRLDEEVFSRADVVAASRAFVTVRVDGDKHPDLVQKLKVGSYPTVLFLAPDGKEIERSIGAVDYRTMLELMARAQKQLASPK